MSKVSRWLAAPVRKTRITDLDERRVSKVHRTILVFVHESADSIAILGSLGCDRDIAFLEEPPESALSKPAARVSQQIHGFGEGGPGGQHRAGHLREACDAGLV